MTDDALPIHFFTIVLNGEPFVRYHESVFSTLPFRWHWHIVEGVAALTHDTAWSVGAGGRILDGVHDRGRSNDGTSAYLDSLAARRPGQVTIHRKPPDQFWDGKREMVNAPLPSIDEPCLLWQIDADELWTADAIAKVRTMFLNQPSRTAAFYWCDFFVGPDRVIATRLNYGANPDHEWLRTWRFAPDMRWMAHEPPTLVDAPGRDVARIDPFLHDEMEDEGITFQHFAYVTSAQVAFKETYYGYRDAVAHWRRLNESAGPVAVRDHLPWVKDDAVADSAATRGVVPIAAEENGVWRFRHPEEVAALRAALPILSPRIVIDGDAFSGGDTSIAEAWTSVLKDLATSKLAPHFLVLDRDGTAPRPTGLHLRTIPVAADSLRLERICREEHADLFLSTGGKSVPTNTPSLCVGLGPIKGNEATHALQHASAHAAITPELAQDMKRRMAWAPATPVEIVAPHDLGDHLLETARKAHDGRLPRPWPVWHDLAEALVRQRGLDTQDQDELTRRLHQSERNLQALCRELDGIANSPFWRLRALTLAVLARLGLRWRR